MKINLVMRKAEAIDIRRKMHVVSVRGGMGNCVRMS